MYIGFLIAIRSVSKENIFLSYYDSGFKAVDYSNNCQYFVNPKFLVIHSIGQSQLILNI